jgi:hypothetical protein
MEPKTGLTGVVLVDYFTILRPSVAGAGGRAEEGRTS